jgi:isoquinoline 1-oxidoreductase subunit alpha
MSSVGGRKVTTIEGLSPNSSHALQKAWIVEQVPQCRHTQSAVVTS